MGLIKCPDCGKKFSDRAELCPKCSCPISEAKKSVNKTTNVKKIENKERFSFKKIIESIKNDKKKKTIFFGLIGLIVLIIFLVLSLTIFNKDWQNANAKYDEAYKIAQKKNNDLEELIKKAENLVYSNKAALNEELRPKLETSISVAKSVKKTLAHKSLFIKEINKRTDQLNKIDYKNEYEELRNDYINLDNSIKKYNLVYKPTEAYVIARLKTVKHVKSIAAVTEDNDPNGNLNKPGGYTATVYYSDNRIKNVSGKTVIEKGTDGGGSIEVYASVEDAVKRRDYLAGYDGGFLATGSHAVVGTVLIRTSDELTASQQKEMEKLIIEALTYIEGDNSTVPEYKPDDTTDKKDNNSDKQNNTNKPDSGQKQDINEISKQIYNEKNKNIGRTELIQILVYEKNFSNDEATKVIESCCNWNESAVVVANNQTHPNYEMYPNFIKDSLKSKGFTTSEIDYALKNCNFDWNQKATSYASLNAEKYYIKKEVLAQLDKLGFTKEQQNYGIENSNIDWKELTRKYVENYFYNEGMTFSYCNEHGGYIGKIGKCPICGGGDESSQYFPCSKDECLSHFVSLGLTESHVRQTLNSYDDNFFVPKSSTRKQLARYTLNRFLVKKSLKPTKEECINKLKEWGFSSEEIDYAISKTESYRFSN